MSITEPTKYVTFNLDDEIYALEIEQVREVLDFTSITKVPQTPDFMKGVINLRGMVVPVVDLKLKFGLKQTKKTMDTRIIITEFIVDGENTVLGAIADSVREVIELEPQDINPAPRIGTRLKTEFIKGMGRKDEEFIIILNIERIFSAEELTLIQDVEDQTKERV